MPNWEAAQRYNYRWNPQTWVLVPDLPLTVKDLGEVALPLWASVLSYMELGILFGGGEDTRLAGSAQCDNY